MKATGAKGPETVIVEQVRFSFADHSSDPWVRIIEIRKPGDRYPYASRYLCFW